MNCNKIINSIVDFVKDNKNIIYKIQKEDNDVFEFKFDINELIAILEKYKNQSILEKESKKIFISHYGNAYITAMLCVEAIINRVNLVIGIDDKCYGLNKAIVKIINDVLDEYKISNKIVLKNNVQNQEIEKVNCDKIICLGDSNSYTSLRKIKNTQVKYVPFFDIQLYYDNEEYEDLVENIRKIAFSNLYEIEIFDQNENFEDVIYMMNKGTNTYCAVMLSKAKEKQNQFTKEVHAKVICINENPFQKFELKIPQEVWRGRF